MGELSGSTVQKICPICTEPQKKDAQDRLLEVLELGPKWLWDSVCPGLCRVKLFRNNNRFDFSSDDTIYREIFMVWLEALSKIA